MRLSRLLHHPRLHLLLHHHHHLLLLSSSTPLSSSSDGPQIYVLEDADIEKILQDARQIGRSQRLISPGGPKGRTVKRRKNKRVRPSIVEESRSSGIEDNEVITPQVTTRGKIQSNFFGGLVKSPRPFSRKRYENKKNLKFQETSKTVPSTSKEPVTGEVKRPVRFRIRGQLPRRPHETDKEETNKEDTDKVDTKKQEKQETVSTTGVRFRSRGQFPRRKQKPTEEVTTPKNLERINLSRVRARTNPRIDPRAKLFESKLVEESKMATSTSAPVSESTTRALPTFNLLEPEAFLPLTESYPKTLQTSTPLAPVVKAYAATPIRAVKSPRLRLNIKDDKVKPVPVKTTEPSFQRQKQRRRGQVPARAGVETSLSEESARHASQPTSRKESVKRIKAATSRKVNPYKRDRSRLVSKVQEEKRPQPYQSKVYGLPQVPDQELEGAASSTGPVSYLDIAINRAEVTWAQDPFRQDSLLADENGPSFDIDFTKDPTRSSAGSTNTALGNLFATDDHASNAISQFHKGAFKERAPESRVRVFGTPTNKKLSVSITEVPAPDISIKLFDPFNFYRNL